MGFVHRSSPNAKAAGSRSLHAEGLPFAGRVGDVDGRVGSGELGDALAASAARRGQAAVDPVGDDAYRGDAAVGIEPAAGTIAAIADVSAHQPSG